MANEIVTARLMVIAAKAKILSEQYKNNQLWGGELDRELNAIESEIAAIRREAGSYRGWEAGDR